MLARSRTAIPRFTRDDKLLEIRQLFEKFSQKTNKRGGREMYTGTLIDDLISSVERAEKYSCQTTGSEEMSQGYWYTPADGDRVSDSKLLGVA